VGSTGPAPSRPRADAGRLWSGGLATAVVAALVGVVGVLIARVLDVDPVSPAWLVGDGGRGSDVSRFALLGAAAALVATGLLHVLLLTVPRPRTFFNWIVGLATVAAATEVFTVDAGLAGQVAGAAITVAIGVAIGSLLSGVAAWSVRFPGQPPGVEPEPGVI
jgi:uncharacterized protein DUF6069